MNPLNGLLLVDKPTGCTSHDVVAKARRILGLRAIGHAGTLDPLASGLLVLLLGEGTKVSDYVLNGDKAYELTLRLGVRTDSFDMTGEVLEEKPVAVTLEQVRACVGRLSGTLELPVPVHSAVKVQGKKLYEYARKDQAVEVPVRQMEFKAPEVVAIDLPLVRVTMRCSKGTYVRAWAERLGRDLGCGAAVEALRRVFSEPYTVSDAITLEKLEETWRAREVRDGRLLGSAWVPLRDTLPGFRTLRVDGQEEVLMRNGQIAKNLQMRLLSFVSEGTQPPGIKVISQSSDDLLALLVAEGGQFYKIRRIFHRA